MEKRTQGASFPAWPPSCTELTHFSFGGGRRARPPSAASEGPTPASVFGGKSTRELGLEKPPRGVGMSPASGHSHWRWALGGQEEALLPSCLPCLSSILGYTALKTCSVTCTLSGKGSASGQHTVLPVPDCGRGLGSQAQRIPEGAAEQSSASSMRPGAVQNLMCSSDNGWEGLVV